MKKAALLLILVVVVLLAVAGIAKAQQPMVVGVMGLKAVPERLQQHGHTEERPGHFDQGEPFGMVTSDGHG